MSRAKALQSYIIVRLLLAPLMLWTITTLVFLLLRATPGDPVDAILGPKASVEAREALRSQLGLDLSLWQQYLNYLGKLFNFDLGTSLTSRGESVWQIISNYFPATVELAVCSMAIALIVGVGVGAISATRPNSIFDVIGRLFGIITYAIPPFWAGMLFQLVFAVQL
ncbi:MAG: ABC transporter permease, partial [Microcoleaceae cyanobacterium]